MTAAATTGTHKVASTKEERKLRKPLIERKRRERINNCLDQLKETVVGAFHLDQSKLEKADILEMTVKHLQNIQSSKMMVPYPVSSPSPCAQSLTLFPYSPPPFPVPRPVPDASRLDPWQPGTSTFPVGPGPGCCRGLSFPARWGDGAGRCSLHGRCSFLPEPIAAFWRSFASAAGSRAQGLTPHSPSPCKQNTWSSPVAPAVPSAATVAVPPAALCSCPAADSKVGLEAQQRYSTGYIQCMHEVHNLLLTCEWMDKTLGARLLNHLLKSLPRSGEDTCRAALRSLSPALQPLLAHKSPLSPKGGTRGANPAQERLCPAENKQASKNSFQLPSLSVFNQADAAPPRQVLQPNFSHNSPRMGSLDMWRPCRRFQC
ncbi:hypothetical protein Nmel_011474 [Mimus melanotis]